MAGTSSLPGIARFSRSPRKRNRSTSRTSTQRTRLRRTCERIDRSLIVPCLMALGVQLDGREPPLAHHVYAMVSTWLEGGEAIEVHRANVKGFRCGVTRWERNGRCEITIGLLYDALLPKLHERLLGDPTIRLGRQTGVLKGAGSDGPGVVRHESWTDLLDASRPTDDFRFRFVGPTVFRSGRSFITRPTPGLVFGHLRARWSVFAPEHLRPCIDIAAVGLQVGEEDLRSVSVPTRHGPVPAFVGEVAFTSRSGSARDLRVLDALGRLAPFAGVGANTTIGMGDTRYGPTVISSHGRPTELPERSG